MADASASGGMLELTARIVSAHLTHNRVAADALPGLIHGVHGALCSLGGRDEPAAPAGRPQPAVPVRRSVFPDYIVCLEDGKKLKMLKRHLQTAFGLTPEQYRDRWQLGADYPMVAPSYARHRSSLAKRSGLGTRPRGTG